VAELARRTFPKNISVSVAFDSSPWRVLADPTHVHQVVMNLAVNARDAMPDGGTLSLGVRNLILDAAFAANFNEAQPGNYVEITVRDTGSGMSQEVQDRIFEPFFTTKPQGKGTGLGLSTSLGIVRSHRGFMHVQSKLGEGSKFFVYFPALTLSSAASVSPKSDAPLWRGDGETVLVIDDEDAVRTIYESVLRDLGYTPLVSAGAQEARAAIRAHGRKIAVVICDWQMPELNGILWSRSCGPSCRRRVSSWQAARSR
jgi:CheY-like chemotaxis protein